MPSRITGLDQIRQRIRQKALLFYKFLIFEAYRRVVLRTPVDTGRARGNWDVSVNEPSSTFDWEKYDKTGSSSITQAAKFVQSVTLDDISYIVNNLPYIGALERGHSKQAPEGMVALTVEEVEMVKKEALRMMGAAEA